jgi:transcriptional regulator with XRE-family HTH domain
LESIGEKLRQAREARKITIKEVVKETNVSPMYLQALEEEKFDRFPSETYLIGFLRTYAEFLKLDVEGIVQAYKGYKIGESATPLEELTKPTKSNINLALSSFVNKHRNMLMITGGALALILVIWGIRSLVRSDVDVSGEDSTDVIKEEYVKDKEHEIDNLRSLQLANNKGFILVYKNEAVQFLVDNKEVVFLLKSISGDTVSLELLPGKKIEKFKMDEPRTLLIEGCPRDVTITLKGLTENRAKIMVMLGEKKEPEAGKDKVAKVDETAPRVDSTSVEAQSRQSLKIVFEAEFVQKSFIELYLDGVRKVRGFIPQGQVERWEATEYIQIKIGNAGGIKARINGKDFSFGAAGQVANKVVTWKKDVQNPNLYHIVVKDW